MHQTALDQLMDRYATDEAFRARLHQDPVSALRSAGIEVSPQTAGRIADAMTDGRRLDLRISRRKC